MKKRPPLPYPESWYQIPYSEAVDNIPTTGKKLNQKQYLNSGIYPVIDQGQSEVGGFTDDGDLIIRCNFPVIVFGDHTRAVKYVKQPFAAGADGVKVLQPREFIKPKLLEYFTRYLAISIKDKGYARHYQWIARELIGIPPLDEQHRIVAKIEELFSELDKGIESLKSAREQLKVYRQSLLKHAFVGKLTEQWREENGLSIQDWRNIAVKDVAAVGTGATPKRGESKYYHNGTYPWVTSGALNYDYVTESVEFITDTALRETNCKLYRPGTILIAMYGEGKTRGKASILQLEAATNQACAAVTVTKEDVLRDYLWNYFKYNYENIRLRSSGGVQPNLNLSHIKNIEFPLPSIEEQSVINEEIELQLTEVKNLQDEIDLNSQKAEVLRQSILKKAFSGQLVPQDPNDLPASFLLERIAAEKAEMEAQAKAAKAAAKKITRRKAS